MEAHNLQEYYTFTKGIMYLFMGGALVGVTMFWQFLMGGKAYRDENKKNYGDHH
ncbi:sulfate respiration complex protein HmcD [Maridesulfovibrio sp.]|uniref:sulfate respiration complex protein HmcD n=1 Tax=Maridesulfovibrio sp. TaxID=2795000 RepID=UPI002A189074|nr:DNA-binding protein [Maridesulfovibrio sp.]